MLNKLIEQGKNKCHRYWPEEIGSTLTFKGTEQKNDLYFTVTLKGFKFEFISSVILMQFRLHFRLIFKQNLQFR